MWSLIYLLLIAFDSIIAWPLPYWFSDLSIPSVITRGNRALVISCMFETFFSLTLFRIHLGKACLGLKVRIRLVQACNYVGICMIAVNTFCVIVCNCQWTQNCTSILHVNNKSLFTLRLCGNTCIHVCIYMSVNCGCGLALVIDKLKLHTVPRGLL